MSCQINRKSALDQPFSYMAGGNYLTFAIPDQTHEGQKLGAETDDSFWRLVGTAWIHHSDATIVGCEGKGISAWRKRASMDPAGGIIQILSTYSVEGEAFPPHATLGSFINPFDEARKDPGMRVRGSSPQQH